MCGIVGILNLNGEPIDPLEFDRFTDSLAPSRPGWTWCPIDRSACIGLGHRRLAILDLSENAQQPMSYENNRYWIVSNAEIYNFLELKKELGGYGYKFVSDSDTEVILASYARWGASCQLKFNGMWAFAIWDKKERKLFLSRDRFGIKPLHYFYDGKRLVFASELKAFLYLSWFNAD